MADLCRCGCCSLHKEEKNIFIVIYAITFIYLSWTCTFDTCKSFVPLRFSWRKNFFHLSSRFIMRNLYHDKLLWQDFLCSRFDFLQTIYIKILGVRMFMSNRMFSPPTPKLNFHAFMHVVILRNFQLFRLEFKREKILHSMIQWFIST
jgi:hypothetical protein